MENENRDNNQSPAHRSTIQESELFLMLSGFLKKVLSNVLLRKIIAKTLLVAGIVSIIIFILSIFLFIVPAIQESGAGRRHETTNIEEVKNSPDYKKQLAALKKDLQRLSWKYSSFTPGQSYLVINTTDNKFFLYRNKKLVRDGFCSSGSYTRLTTAEGNRQWIFKTPKGKFWIQQKIVKPLWIRPDWSFVEEGLPVPAVDDASRYEYGVLGDYAMSLGDGYLIHGTIYKRFLGMPVTHGCVRLNDEDLETIFNTLNIGSKVYIL